MKNIKILSLMLVLAVGVSAQTDKDKKPATDNQEDSDKQKSKLADKKVKQYVYLYNGETVKQVEVTTGIQNDQFIIIKSGLKAGQDVVTGPYSAIQNKLKDGMKVKKTTKDQLFADSDKK